MSLGTSAASFLFKNYYPSGLDNEALVRKKPLLQWANHRKDFTTQLGITIPVPFVNPQGIGATNAAASSAEVSSQGKSFVVPQRHVTHFAAIDGVIVRNTINGSDTTQFTDVMTREIDGATEAIGAEIHQRMYGDNTGVRSYLSATGALNTTTWFLANTEDAQFYEVNMQVVLVNPATGLARVGTATTVTAVDPIAGTITCAANPNTFTSAAASDGIARSSMVGADMDGLNAWCPVTVTPGESFMGGVDRSVYRTRLAGVYVDCSGSSIRSAYIKALAVGKQQVGTKFESKSPIFIHTKNLAQIVQSVEAVKVVDRDLDDKYGIGIEAVQVLGYTFVEDPLCPVNTAYLIGTNAFTRATCGNQPQIDDSDGGEFFYNRRTGVLEFCIAHDGNCGSFEPYNILRMNLPNQAL